tara:strand:+ start:124 stop:3048 length:2925 start_codon:yes stop_codon:yes gene_type:complete
MSKTEIVTYEVTAPDGSLIEVKGPKGQEARAIEEAKKYYQKNISSPEEPSFLDEAAFAFDLGRTDIDNLSILTEAAFPSAAVGYSIPGITGDYDTTDFRIYIPARERYGDAFVDEMSYEERKEFLIKRDEQEAISNNLETFLYQQEQGKDQTAAALGDTLKLFATPTTLVPAGQTPKMMAGTGMLLGAWWDTLDQTIAGTTDLWQKAKTTMISTVAPVAGDKAFKLLQSSPKAVQNVFKFIGNKLDRRTDAEKSVQVANDLVDRLEIKYAEGVALGKPAAKIRADVNKELGLTEAQVLESVADATKPLVIPSRTTANQILLAKENPTSLLDPTTKAFNKVVTPISSAIKDISETVGMNLRNMDRKVHESIGNEMDILENFLNVTARQASPNLGKMSNEYESFQNHLFNGQYKEAQKIADEHFPELGDSLETVSRLLNKKFDELKEVGVDVGYLENYFPRMVKDTSALLNALGSEKSSLVTRALKDLAEKKGLNRNDYLKLDEETISDTINKVLNGYIPTKAGLSFTKTRKIEEMPVGLQQYYYSAPESIMLYIQNATREIEKRKLFGKSTSLDETGKFDIDASIGNLVQKELREGKITEEGADDLARMLKARFDGEKKVMGKAGAMVRDLQYMALLGQPDAALIQLGDIGVAAYLNGTKNAIGSLFGKKRLDSEDLGIMNKVSDQIAAEVANMNGFNKSLNKVLKATGFRTIDKLGKDVLIDSSLKKWQQLASKNPDVIRKKWGKHFEGETESVIGDLQKGNITDNVKLMVWNDLADAQPITLSEMPEAYLNNPNGRLLYALKTFALKQLDLTRRQIYREYKKGNKKEALKNAARYAAVVGGGNASVQTFRDHVMAAEVPEIPDSPEEAAVGAMDAVAESLLAQFFMGNYQRDRYLSQGDIGGYASSMLTPPAVNITVKQIRNMLDEDEDDNIDEIVRNMPIVGKAYYNFVLGGMEKRKDKLEEEGLIESLVNR